MFSYQTIKDIEFAGENVLVRTDYNVSIKDGVVVDDFRIRASLPTLKYLREHGASKIIVISHLGRPEGKKVPEMSLKPVAECLQKMLPQVPVRFIAEVSGSEVEAALEDLPEGGILMLENLRFYPGEEANSADFAREIVDSVRAGLFVQDGFAVIHRAHASTARIPEIIPAVAGLLVEKEVKTLEKALRDPAHPFVVVIGGAKVEDKQPLIDKFAPIADQIIVGGKISADGYTSDEPKVHVANEDFDENADGAKLDLGPLATAKVLELVKPAQTVLWNGTLGYAEDPPFDTSSTALAHQLATSDCTSIICGGDTTAFVHHYLKTHKDAKFSLISTGGGAALELLLGKPLPGLEALERK